MLRFYGNNVTVDTPSELQLDVQRMQELYRLRDIDGYGKIAPNRLATTVLIKHEAPRDDAEDAAIRKE